MNFTDIRMTRFFVALLFAFGISSGNAAAELRQTTSPDALCSNGEQATHAYFDDGGSNDWLLAQTRWGTPPGHMPGVRFATREPAAVIQTVIHAPLFCTFSGVRI